MMMMTQLTLFALPWLRICGRITAMENLGLFVVRHYLTTCLQISSQTHARILPQRTLPTVTRMKPDPSDLLLHGKVAVTPLDPILDEDHVER